MWNWLPYWLFPSNLNILSVEYTSRVNSHRRIQHHIKLCLEKVHFQLTICSQNQLQYLYHKHKITAQTRSLMMAKHLAYWGKEKQITTGFKCNWFELTFHNCGTFQCSLTKHFLQKSICDPFQEARRMLHVTTSQERHFNIN